MWHEEVQNKEEWFVWRKRGLIISKLCIKKKHYKTKRNDLSEETEAKLFPNFTLEKKKQPKPELFPVPSSCFSDFCISLRQFHCVDMLLSPVLVRYKYGCRLPSVDISTSTVTEIYVMILVSLAVTDI